VSTTIVAEIGINHNASLDIARKLIDVASFTGCDFVKFQKRTPELCVPEEQKNKPKETPWGIMTYFEYKKKMEFGESEYTEIDAYCKSHNIRWFASVCDLPSCDFMKKFSKIGKIPSALITDLELCRYARECFDFLIISTGMSTEEEIEKMVEVAKPNVIMHTNSSYPALTEELNLMYIEHLKWKYPHIIRGYSGHEFGLIPTMVAVILGAEWVERHITLNRTMFGSDQMASVEPHGLMKLVKGIRSVEKSLGSGGPREVSSRELEKRKSLRGT
jgi:N-acetylneuraminate synthase